MRMTRRRLLLLALPVALGCSAALLWVVWPHTAITPDNAAKIKRGMTLAEVEAILGGPPGNYASNYTGLGTGYAGPGGALIVFDVQERTTWAGDDGMLTVFLDNDGRVRKTQFYEVIDRDTFMGSIRRWLLGL
jgi:hypothetical protein